MELVLRSETMRIRFWATFDFCPNYTGANKGTALPTIWAAALGPRRDKVREPRHKHIRYLNS